MNNNVSQLQEGAKELKTNYPKDIGSIIPIWGRAINSSLKDFSIWMDSKYRIIPVTHPETPIQQTEQPEELFNQRNSELAERIEIAMEQNMSPIEMAAYLQSFEPEQPVKKPLSADDLIKSIHVDRANFEYIAKTGIINGTLLQELRRILGPQPVQPVKKTTS